MSEQIESKAYQVLQDEVITLRQRLAEMEQSLAMYQVAVENREQFPILNQNQKHLSETSPQEYPSNSTKIMEKQLRHQTFHDALTNLPNRTLFMELLEHAIKRVRRPQSRPFAVLFLDLDNFKVVNDSLGHLQGDQLLVTTAGRLKACLRSSDTIARFGGDEFVILQEDINDINDVVDLVELIQQELARPLNLHNRELMTSACIGIALSSSNYAHPADMLRDADTAMYRAKALGPGHYAVFDTTMHAHMLKRLDTEAALRRAIDQNELRVHYQPIVELSTLRIIGFEALVRWLHPERGMMTPGEFIPIAEETGLIVPLGWWVLRESCRQMQTWKKFFLHIPPLSINVNLSSQVFSDVRTVNRIHQILDDTQFDPQHLKLEITENVMMAQTESTIQTMMRLHDMGIQLCIDDFGTGYSSLRYLHRFPIQTLKIDQSFISTLDQSNESTTITQSIVTLSHALGKSVVAEGIETVDQLNYLQHLHCEYGQGFLFSRPLHEQAIEELISAHNGKIPPPLGMLVTK